MEIHIQIAYSRVHAQVIPVANGPPGVIYRLDCALASSAQLICVECFKQNPLWGMGASRIGRPLRRIGTPLRRIGDFYIDLCRDFIILIFSKFWSDIVREGSKWGFNE